MSFYQVLKEFISQAHTDNLKTKHFISGYSGTKVKISFGQGGVARIPWISFLLPPNTTSDGIYPVYLYFKKHNILILAYGVSETNTPINNWEVQNKKTVAEYFEEQLSEKPDRYGDSLIYKVYNVQSLPSQDLIDEDLKNILEYYQRINKFEIKKEQEGLNLKTFLSDLKHSGLFYSQVLVSRFVASLLTKPFLILTGLSGSGKTKLAQSFAQWICENESQYALVPVGADWTNREPLLGYPNALKVEEYIKPDNKALDLILKAINNQNLPYFLILDEMNLSHVERYFADFLSVMESKKEISLHSNGDSEKNGVPKSIMLPPNLFIIGTVNIDETTNMFSPKVLDRANTIEFRVDVDEMVNFLNGNSQIAMDELTGKGINMAESFLQLSRDKRVDRDEDNKIKEVLIDFFEALKPAGAEFGYRSATEMLRLIHKLGVIDADMGINQKLDIAIIQKLLPKLHGSRKKLCSILETLGGLCLSKKTTNKEVQKIFEDEKEYKAIKDSIKFPLSFEKLRRMHKSAIEHGFASFAEA